MAFDPDQFLAATSTAVAEPPVARGFDPDKFLKETEPKSLAGFGKNVVRDIADTGKSLFGPGGLGQRLMEHPIDTTADVVKGIPHAVVEEGKRLGVGELLTGHPINAIEKLGDAAYEKPLTTAMSVVPAVGAAGKTLGIGGKAGKAAEIAAGTFKALPAAEELASAAAKTAPKAGGKLSGVVDSLGKAVSDPLKEVNDYVTTKYGKAAAKPGWSENVAKYLKNEAADIRGKDIGLQPRQIKSMGEGFEGLKKAEDLMDYAADKGYFDPKLTDVARKEKIISETAKAGQNLGAVRDIASKRGAPPMPEMMGQVKAELVKKYGIKAAAEVKKTLSIIQQAVKNDPTFSGMADLATELNRAKTPAAKLGQNVGPMTDAANAISRMNNEAIRALLNPEEQALYTDSLRNYGAHKKLEQAVAASGRRSMSARSNQRGILGRLWQEALDRGGYRMAGNVADRTAKAILKDPTRVKTLPAFFEELAHHADDVLDETFDIQGMADGGIVGNQELNDFLSEKYANKGAKK